MLAAQRNAFLALSCSSPTVILLMLSHCKALADASNSTGNVTRLNKVITACAKINIVTNCGPKLGNAKAPKEPFPKDFDLSRIDKHSRNLLPIDPVESRQVLDKGYRELVGGLLWPARNAYPAASFACSVLSRYMQTPTEEAFSAGIHTLHYLVEHRHV